jgi:HK97 family phage major capsid protein
MSIGSDPDGGYSVSNQLSTELMRRLYNFSPVRQLARVVEVGSYGGYEEPRQIGDTGATWVGETEARPATTTPTLALVSVPLHEIYSNQPITARLIEDSRFDIGAFAIERIVERMARAEGTTFVTGDGVNQPKGFLSYDSDSAADFTRDPAKLQYVVSGGATTITLDGIKNLFWALRAPHRVNGSWLMSSATAAALDKLKDGDGTYLWRPSVAVDAPATLLGRPVYYSEDMPAIGASAMAVAFGNFTAGYLVIDRPGIRLVRDQFTSRPSIVIYGYRRVGGGVADTDAIKLLKVSA